VLRDLSLPSQLGRYRVEGTPRCGKVLKVPPRAIPVEQPSPLAKRRALLVVGTALFVVVGSLAAWLLLHIASNDKLNDTPKNTEKDRGQGESQTVVKGIGKPRDENTPRGVAKPTEPLAQVKRTGPEETISLPLIGKPNNDPTKEVGRFVSRGEALVYQTKDGKWERVPLNGPVFTGKSLVSLPGYKSELRLKSGVNLLLWGALPELPLRLPLMESAVILHNAPTGLDADLTLQRGRIFLTNRKEKGPARVRVRFWREEVWDVTLEEPDTTAGIEFVSTYYNSNANQTIKFRSGEEPLAVLVLHVIKGRAQVKVNYDTFALQAPPRPALIYWNNKRTRQEGPIPIPKPIPDWDPDLKLARKHQELAAAREELVGQLAQKGKSVETGLRESLQSSKPEHRVLATRCLGAIDAVSTLVDSLGDPMNPEVRVEATAALRNWIGRGKDQAAKLFDRKKRTGILVDRKFRRADAESVLELLDGFTLEDLRQPETYDTLLDYLKHNRIEVRELAYAHLIEAVGEDKEKPSYNPAGTSEQIKQSAEEWQKFLRKKLTPKPKSGKP